MTTLNILRLLRRRALVTRESARPIGSAILAAKHADTREVTLDFSGIDAVAPSFVDELLATLEAIFRGTDSDDFCLVLQSPPTRLSSKFSAIARARGLQIVESEAGTWIVTVHKPSADGSVLS
jgi:hypothetical protein